MLTSNLEELPDFIFGNEALVVVGIVRTKPFSATEMTLTSISSPMLYLALGCGT